MASQGDKSTGKDEGEAKSTPSIILVSSNCNKNCTLQESKQGPMH
jgi:hypothetical protein